MPVLRFKPEKLIKLTGLSLDEIMETLFKLKCESELIDEDLEVEINPDRPDLYISEGLARAINGLQGKRKGWKKPKIIDSGYSLEVRPPSTRPYIAAAIVYNVNIDEDFLEELIQFQEKLHDTIGRRRRKVAIGIHDLDKLPSKNLRYIDESLDADMIPLDDTRRYSIRQVLENTTQGQKYGNISLNTDRGTHPALYSGEEIIAIPPVINSNVTRLEPGTKHVFIDVTGTHRETVNKVLDIIVTALTEREGAYIGSIKIYTPQGEVTTPLLTTKTLRITRQLVTQTLGLELSLESITDSLGRTLHNVTIEENSIIVTPAPFRVDIIREVDLIEDIAIALGYESLGFNRPVVESPGKLLPESRLSRVLRELAIGLGFTEVTQLTLISPKLLDYTHFHERVEILNPVQYEYSALRPSLIPSLLSVAAKNVHARKPVKVFEIGMIVKPGSPPTDHLHMALLIMDDEVGYEDIQASVYSILRILDVDFKVEPTSHPVFITGRAARLLTSNGEELAIMGEVNPEILEKLEISFPIAVADLDVEVLARWKYKTSNRH
ncbi:MAG: phenylalanine--tRNA ligase subunit beta [Desulfurococcales archaeon]|nr:phenylalanine--tRNA ligase subunit beta [Desulfurococcales archaeon]MCE4627162.1 phenylalanine--tRNA ligase subunit beta [Desulfurococcales archaeon]